jgi:hypothetical protein
MNGFLLRLSEKSATRQTTTIYGGYNERYTLYVVYFETEKHFSDSLVARYVAGGHTRETALRFAREEIAAIRNGNHWMHGKPAPTNPRCLIVEVLTPEDRERFTETGCTAGRTAAYPGNL